MKNFLYCFLISGLLYLTTFRSAAQTVANYVFSPASSTFSALTGATAITRNAGNMDDGYANNISLGFTFYYNSTAYSTLSVSTNGFVTLGQSIGATNNFGNNLTAGTNPLSPRPILAPLWDDLNFFNTTDVSYLRSGIAPNRVFTMQWLNARWQYNAAASGISLQLKLYEADSKIEFLYRAEAGTLLNPSASIGITNAASGPGNFFSITSTGNNPYDTSTVSETNTLNTKPANGQSYAFIPKYVLPAAPAALSFSLVSATSMTVNWIDNTISETYYQVFMSSDNINFSKISTIYSTSVTSTGTVYQYSVSGLNTGSTYYFRVFACNEGSASTNYVSGSQTTLAGLLSGVKTICPSGCDYTSIGNANTDIRSKGINGSLILELDATYSPSVETYPLNFGNLLTNGSNNITLKPRSNVTNVINFISVVSPTFDFNTTNYLTIDGSKGGLGTQSYINISNFSSSGTAIRFQNGANYNTVSNCRISGASTSINTGVITFASTTGTNGNSNNTFLNCVIKDTISNPIYAIYSSGNANYPNLNNTIYGNTIFDYFNSSNPTYGIYLTTGNNAWFIGNNHFYQTASRSLSFNNTGAIFASSGAAYTIFGNYIGGSAPLCTGNAMAYDGTGSITFINMNLPTNNTCYIQNNVMQNISMNLSGTPNSFINMANGSFSISGNVIGSTTASTSIRFTSTASNIQFSPMLLSGGTSYDNISINANSIGGISIGGTGNVQFRGINIATAVPLLLISDNLIGSLTSINSICDSTAQGLYGISATLGSSNNTISGNIIANLTASNASTNTRLYGIFATSAGTFTITGNTVRNLTTASTSINTGLGSPLTGILHNASGLNQVCTGNIVNSLYATDASLATSINGIYYSNTSSGTNILSGNFVHSIVSQSSGASVITGIYNGSSGVVSSNNRVRLGIDTAGLSVNANHIIAGINDAGNSNAYYHNSVFIGGNAVNIGANNTYAFYNSAASTGTRAVINNIFCNARSNSLGSGRNYAIYLNSVTLTGFLLNYNIYYAPGLGGTIGRFNGVDYMAFNPWRSVTFSDYNSGLGDPNFAAPNGSSGLLSLKVQSPTPAEGAGTPLATVTDDFDGDIRSSFTPADIGSDAGNYTGVDIFSPTIVFTPLTNTASTANRTLIATISDVGTGVRNTGSLQPRIWYRRTAPTASGWFNTGGVLTAGNGINGTWNFTIDYSLTGAAAAVGNQFQYYIVVQDSASPVNLFYNPFPGANHSNVYNQVSAPANPNQYNIVNNFPTAVNVGAGQTYTTLTGSGGLFASINAGALSGNTIATIVSDITESGTFLLSNSGMAGFNLLIKPDNNPRVLSGSLVAGALGLISLNGARGVTIDGGSARNLTIRNVIGTTPNNTTAPAVYFWNATNDTIRNCIIESNESSNANATLMLGTSSAANPSSGIVISNNILRPAANVNSNAPAIAILVNSAAGNISNSVISQNKISDYTLFGVYLANAGNNITIGDPTDTSKGNIFYQTASRSNHFSILAGSGNGHIISSNAIYSTFGVSHTGPVNGIFVFNNINNITISNNSIGGTSPIRSGRPYTLAANFTAISFGGGTLATSSITNNRISNISLTGASVFTGIVVNSGNTSISNNWIGGAAVSTNAYDTIHPSQDFYGIRFTSASNHIAANNLVSNIYNYGTGLTTCMSVEAGVASVTGNTIRDITTYASTNITADYSCNGIRISTATSGNNIENNQVFNLSNLSNAASVTVSGITITNALNSGFIQRNRIYNLIAGSTNGGGNSPIIRGIYISSNGSATYANNQITIKHNLVGTQPRIRGIELNTWGGTNSFFYNSIYIGGIANGANTSTAFYRNTNSATAALLVKNNIFYNERSGGGTHYAMSANFNTNFTNDNNLFVSGLPASIIEYAIGTGRSLTSWNSLSGNPNFNLGNTYNQLNATLFFPNLANGDLSTSSCRVSNAGAFVAITNDFTNAIRSSPSDIGSVEFDTATGLMSILTHPVNVNIACGPANAQFTLVTSGYIANYQWEENRGSGWNNLSNAGVYSGVNTATLTISGPAPAMNLYQYRCSVIGVCGTALTSNTATLTVSNTSSWTGTASTAWGNSANWSCGIVPVAGTDVVIGNVSNQPVISDGGRTCNNLTIDSLASLTLNNTLSSLNIKGLVALNGTLSNSNGIIIFSGTTTQNIPGINYNNLTLSNPGGATLSGNAIVNGTLNFTNGILYLGNNNLTMSGTSSTITGANANRFVLSNGTGTLNIQNIGIGGRTGVVTFPIGTGTGNYSPVMMANSGTSDEFRMRVFLGLSESYNSSNVPVGATILNNAVNRTWIINEANAGGSTTTLALQWNVMDELTGFTRGSSYVARYNGIKWMPNTISAAAGTNPYTQTISGVTAFSPFGVGSGGTLPVTWVDLNAIKSEANVILNWSCAQEINSDLFLVERSYDGKNFEHIGSIKAAGNSSSITHYKYLDPDAFSNLKLHQQSGGLASQTAAVIYYQLKVKDFDGSITVSKIVSVQEFKKTETADITLFPNPFSESFSVRILSESNNNLKFSLTDISGKTLYSKTFWLDAGINTIQMSNSNFSINYVIIESFIKDQPSSYRLNAGIYFISIESPNGRQIHKLIKQ
ncbi:MAG: fibronectin type III domain-containing protein [Bacteroidota bacterium]|nr:fibronectin type III domain-containing protein [Bacteroidota bacterium]